jgi:hypothetical protein
LYALRFFTGKIVEQQVKTKVPDNTLISAITGLVFTLLNEHIPKELLFFMRHANRKSIKEEDFLLYCRKTDLHQHLVDYSNQIKTST